MWPFGGKNRTAPAKDETRVLKETVSNLRLQNEIQAQRTQLKLQEQLSYSPPYDLISPWAQFY